MLPKDFFKKVWVVDAYGEVTPVTNIISADNDKIEICHSNYRQIFHFNSQNNLFASGVNVLVFDLFSEETRKLIEDRVIKRSAEIQEIFRKRFESYLNDMKSFRDVIANNEKVFKEEINSRNSK